MTETERQVRDRWGFTFDALNCVSPFLMSQNRLDVVTVQPTWEECEIGGCVREIPGYQFFEIFTSEYPHKIQVPLPSYRFYNDAISGRRITTVEFEQIVVMTTTIDENKTENMWKRIR